MIRQLLLIIIISGFNCGLYAQQNDLRIVYDASQGNSQLTGATKVYMFAKATATIGEGSWESTVGSTNQDDGIGQMIPSGNNTWSICINPVSYFNLNPDNGTLQTIDLYFRNENGTATGYSSAGNHFILNMENNLPVSNYKGLTVSTCVMGEKEIPYKDFIITNFPNPVKSSTILTYNLKNNATHVAVRVYDVIGQCVKTFNQDAQKPGVYKISWTGDNDKGALVKNGLYFYSLEVDGRTVQTNRLVLSR